MNNATNDVWLSPIGVCWLKTARGNIREKMAMVAKSEERKIQEAQGIISFQSLNNYRILTAYSK